MNRIKSSLVAGALVLTASFGLADTHTWNGCGANSNASTAANWVEGAPATGDDIVLATANSNMIWDADAPASVGSWSQIGYLGTVTVATVYGASGFINFTITGNCVISNGVWTHTTNDTTEVSWLKVAIGGNLIVGAGAKISADGKSASGGPGTGANNVRGSSYGGQSGSEAAWSYAAVPAPTYGSITSPTNLGSGMGGTFRGGGAIRLQVSGQTTIDGLITATNSSYDNHCLPSGGSIWLTTGALAGTGAVKACGGPTGGKTCGGGGGRIALIVTNALADFSGFSGIVIAAGGQGAAAGTIYKEKPADSGRGELIVDNNFIWSPIYVATRLGGTNAVTCDFSRIVLTNAGNLGLFGADTLTLTSTVIVGGPGPATNCGGISLYGAALALPATYSWSNFFIRVYTNAGSSISCQDITLETNGMLIVDLPWTFSNVTVKAGGILSHDPNYNLELFRLDLTITSNLTVDAGGAVNVNRRGFGSGSGRGTGPNGGGSSYGGHGKYPQAGQITYGSIIAPTNLGSGAFSGPGYDKDWGGGAAILRVGETTTLEGLMTAEGGPRDGNGGAAGGSIYLTTGRLLGSGAIKAQGGSGSPGGGGGRIAVVLTNSGASFADFTGSLSASGQGGGPGGAGTIYLRAPNQATNEGALIVDNGGLSATVGALITTSVTDTAVGDVLIRNNGVLALDTNQSLTVGGMWSNSATFNATNGTTVILAGSGTSTSTIYGTSVFYRLTCAIPGKTLKFLAGASNAVREALVFTGASGSNIILRSTADGTQWKLNVASAAIQSVSRVDAKDSDARPGALVSPTYSTDAGNNSNWTFIVAGQTNTWTGVISGAWGNSGNWSLGWMPSLADDKASIPAGCPNYPALDTVSQVAGLDLAAGASLNLNGFYFTIYGNANMAGTLRAIGSERLTFLGGVLDFTGGGAVTAASSTIVIGGAGAQTVNLAGKTFWNLLVTNVAGSVTLNGGCAAKQFMFDGGASPLSVNFAAGVPFNVRDLVMPGSAATTNITLRSATPGSAWLLNVSAYSRLTGVDVKDSDAGGGNPICPLSSKDSGSNSNWVFNAPWSAWLGTNSSSFTNPANWNPAVAPDSNSLILVETTNIMIIGTATTVRVMMLGGSTSAVQVQVNAPLTVTEDVTVRTNATLWINQPMTVGNDVMVLAGGTLTHTSNVASELYKLNLVVGSNLFVDAGGAVNVNRRGYAGGSGPGGSGSDAYGASYGGRGGGDPGANTYGSVVAPTNIGSGAPSNQGYDKDWGGGAAILRVGETTTLEGLMTAEGGPRDGNSGAAGGTIFLTTGRLLGSGAIKAQGGIAAKGGGGGRISVVLTGVGASFTNFTGSMTASGQGAPPYGGAGTIYLKRRTGRGDVIVNNAGLSSSTTRTPFPPSVSSVSNELRNARLLITNSGCVKLTAAMSVADVYIYPGAVLDLTNCNLNVYTREHALGGGAVSNAAGGQIIWILLRTMFSVY